VQEVGGAVEGIDEPHEAVRRAGGGELLAQDPGARGGGQQGLRDQPLGLAIDVRDEVPLSLDGPFRGAGRIPDRAEVVPGPLGRRLGDVE